MRMVKTLVLMCAVILPGAWAQATIVSSWNMDDVPTAPWADYVYGIDDQVDSNPGVIRSRYEGYAIGLDEGGGDICLRITNGSKTAFAIQTNNGLTIDQGHYEWSYRTNGYTPTSRDVMIRTHQLPAGTTSAEWGLRLLYIEDGAAKKLQLEEAGDDTAGTILGTSGDLSSSLFDGNWHGVELRYKDGESIQVWVDDLLVLSSASNYNQSSYTLISGTVMCLGNGGSGKGYGLEGDYDDLLFDNAIPEPATMGLLAMGGLGVLVRRKR
jgi:hypothetical protein